MSHVDRAGVVTVGSGQSGTGTARRLAQAGMSVDGPAMTVQSRSAASGYGV